MLTLAAALFWRTPMLRETDRGVLMHYPHKSRFRGFSILDLLIILSITFACIVMSTPLINKYSIQARMAKAFAEADRARSITAMYCRVNPSVAELGTAHTGYVFHASPYVKTLQLDGTCDAPAITLVTRNTGASPDPTITLSGVPNPRSSRLEWTCSSNGSSAYISGLCG
jgi:hypothetical protein